MWTPHEVYESLGETRAARQIAYRRLFEEELNTNVMAEIKESQATGFLLGTEKFRQEYELLTGVQQSKRKRGRKPDESM